ncbi:MAG: hypothetical protein HUU43_15530 [Ignavibacteriaceae bacterium]|nr:hypothetical protein [Ignavibacteriaceae bacterium]
MESESTRSIIYTRHDTVVQIRNKNDHIRIITSTWNTDYADTVNKMDEVIVVIHEMLAKLYPEEIKFPSDMKVIDLLFKSLIKRETKHSTKPYATRESGLGVLLLEWREFEAAFQTKQWANIEEEALDLVASALHLVMSRYIIGEKF